MFAAGEYNLADTLGINIAFAQQKYRSGENGISLNPCASARVGSQGTIFCSHNAISIYLRTRILQTVADLYCQAGVEKWSEYDIVLGGGYLNCRSPYNLEAGTVTYGMLMSLLPFDNRLVLCSVSGQNLLSKFINTTNSNYYIAYSQYGQQIAGSIDPNKTYYIIVDSYTAYYAPNKLTVIDFYDEDIYARDLLAKYIEDGNL